MAEHSEYTSEQIRNFWTEQAGLHGQAPAASWSDKECIELEIRELMKYLADGDSVLDVGCANGYSTTRFAAEKKLSVRGLDYIPVMIEQANLRLKDTRSFLKGTIEFGVGDITGLKEATGTYDKVVVTRVVINLGDWETQVVAINECARVLRSGGMLLMSEATLQGWRKLNDFRREWGLSEIPIPGFNHYLDEERVVAAGSNAGLELIDIGNFASTYFVGTRILKPLLINALASTGASVPDAANPNTEWNRFFGRAPAWGDYGTQKLFRFRKK